MEWDFFLDPFKYAQIPFGLWIQSSLDWAVTVFRGPLLSVKQPIQLLFRFFEDGLRNSSPLLGLGLVFLISWLSMGLRGAALAVVGFIVIGSIGAWADAMTTIAIVFTALVLCAIIGIPIGIIAGKSDRFWVFLRPTLDFMQTIPSFVYLVPVAMLFGIGNIPGIIVTCFYAISPLIRLTNLGIRNVRRDLVEAGEAFGSSPLQLLFKVEIPLARPTILAGVNQCVMMSLNMAVIASMISVAGLGRTVLGGIGRLDVGAAAVGGLGIVLIAIVIDRVTQGFGMSVRERAKRAWYDAGLVDLVSRFARGR
jgi:glycine betaine/proline transport system permease protein